MWFLIIGIALTTNLFFGCYVLRKQHTDAIINRWVSDAVQQGLSKEEAESAVGTYISIRNFFWFLNLKGKEEKK